LFLVQFRMFSQSQVWNSAEWLLLIDISLSGLSYSKCSRMIHFIVGDDYWSCEWWWWWHLAYPRHSWSKSFFLSPLFFCSLLNHGPSCQKIKLIFSLFFTLVFRLWYGYGFAVSATCGGYSFLFNCVCLNDSFISL